MIFNSRQIILFFRYLWLILALVVILYLINQNIIQERTLTYHLDFAQAITRDLEGLYPRERTSYLKDSAKLQILAEPLYLQAYLPTKFKTLKIQSFWHLDQNNLKIALKQKDSSWLWKNVEAENFSLDFDLQQASLVNNKIELIFSLPDLKPENQVLLDNLDLVLEK
ncbi:hypothetical protein H6761_00980 [Candidatus Nomurabacteria bacterium]|nr:hypothetical protein [Candidatus Nomurabacteria bacterium]